MKSLRDYLEEAEILSHGPAEGDQFAINIREEFLLETYVVESKNDSVVLHADERTMQVLEAFGMLGESFVSDMDQEETEDDAAAADIEHADQGEYNYEGDMAKDDLETIVRAARRLTGMLDDNENMPEWVQSKINKAADYVDTAADYIESNQNEKIAEGETPESELERLKLRQNAEHGRAPLRRQAATQARIRELEKQIKDKQGMAEGYQLDEISQDTVMSYLSKRKETDVDGKTPQQIEKMIKGLKSGVARAHGEQPTSLSKKKEQGVAEGMLDNPGKPDSPVAQAIIRRILMQRTDLLAKYGPNKVGAAVDEVADFVGDVDEIGSSDVSGWVRHVEQMLANMPDSMDEAKYQGREVPLGKPMAGDVKKSKVYVRGPKGNVVKVNFGQKGMKIKKSIPGRRKNFRARHNCDNPGPRWKARYWSCRAW